MVGENLWMSNNTTLPIDYIQFFYKPWIMLNHKATKVLIHTFYNIQYMYILYMAAMARLVRQKKNKLTPKIKCPPTFCRHTSSFTSSLVTTAHSWFSLLFSSSCIYPLCPIQYVSLPILLSFLLPPSLLFPCHSPGYIWWTDVIISTIFKGERWLYLSSFSVLKRCLGRCGVPLPFWA